jgi:hypothetical protein
VSDIFAHDADDFDEVPLTVNEQGERYILFPCQRAVGLLRSYREPHVEGDEPAAETLVLPNLIVYLFRVPGSDVRFGQHIMCSPIAARDFVENIIPEKVAKLNAKHEGDFFSEALDPQEVFGAADQP